MLIDFIFYRCCICFQGPTSVFFARFCCTSCTWSTPAAVMPQPPIFAQNPLNLCPDPSQSLPRPPKSLPRFCCEDSAAPPAPPIPSTSNILLIDFVPALPPAPSRSRIEPVPPSPAGGVIVGIDDLRSERFLPCTGPQSARTEVESTKIRWPTLGSVYPFCNSARSRALAPMIAVFSAFRTGQSTSA